MKTKKDKKGIEVPKTDLTPRGRSILVQQISFETKAASGLIIAESRATIRPTGIIVACGPDCKDDIKEGIGRPVLFNPYANLQIIDGHNNVYYFMEDMDVRCFIHENTIIMDNADMKFARIDIEQPES